MSITYEKARPSGAWTLSANHGGYYVSRTYYGYNKREATCLFREYLKSR